MSKSWRRTLNARRHAIAESDSSTEGCKETLLTKSFSNPDSTTFCSNCCTCKLEMKVLNDEMNEQVSHEKHNTNKKMVEDLTALLRSVSIYVHCIDIRHKAADRLQNVITEIIPIHETPQERKVASSWFSHSNKLHEIMSSCNENIDLPSTYYECLDDYKDRYKDYTKASSNFCQILENEVSMSNTQLRKLELQYDEIRLNYSNSKTNVSSQLKNIITKRSELVESSIQALLPILHEVIEQDRSIYNFLKGVSFSNVKCERVSSSKSLQEKNLNYCRRKSDEKSCSCSQVYRESH
ncbi:uncharacterized protein [Halyomorpha halys]|uniref:uncharacterized protein isoform X2 n=1 Tax=Halyomorpha halys TaxID=286706 RepID=UPI000D0C7A01|nr:uncharacterized protein LOC106681160 isoform X2 [Halyomorpha halys]